MISNADTKKRYRVDHADGWFRVRDTKTGMWLDVIFWEEDEALSFAEKLNGGEAGSL